MSEAKSFDLHIQTLQELFTKKRLVALEIKRWTKIIGGYRILSHHPLQECTRLSTGLRKPRTRRSFSVPTTVNSCSMRLNHGV